MSKKVIIELMIKEGVLDKLQIFLESNLPSVRGFIGCLSVTVFLDKKSRIMIFDEEWLSIEHHKEYINAITGNGVMSELISFLESPPDIKYLDRMEM